MAQFIADSLDHLPSLDELTSMSGLAFMQNMLAGRLSGPPIGAALNYWLDQVEEGRVVFRGAPGFEALNPMRSVHGGWYGTLLDSAMACAVMTILPQGQRYTTLEYKVNLVRAIPTEFEIIASGDVQHAGRSTAVANGEIRGVSDDRLYATGSTTCLIYR